MEKNIYITRPVPSHAVETLRNQGFTVDVQPKKSTPTKKEIISALKKKNYTVLVSFLTDTVDAEVLDACPTIGLVVNYAVGFNNINIEDAKARKIVVANTAGTSGAAVAEFTVALMLSLSTRLVEGDRFVREKKFKGWDPYLLLGSDVGGKTIGLLGAGDIGSRVAQMMTKGFGCNILYFDMKPNETLDNLGAKFVSQEEVLKQSDIISLHVPLLPSTIHLINKETISLMKQNVLIINTSRGPVINETQLTEALVSGRIAGAALDVFEFEPKISRTLRKLENVIITPHIASARNSVRESMADKVASVISNFFSGGEVKNLAD